MPRISFTSLALKSLKAPTPKNPDTVSQVDYFDETTPGFGLRISSNDVRTWFVMDRIAGRVTRLKLGRVQREQDGPGMTLADARALATAHRKDIAKGVDPRQRPAPAVDVAPEPAPAPVAPVGTTFDEVATQFIEKWAKPRTRRWKETEQIFKRLVSPAVGAKAMGAISRRDIGDLLDTVATGNGPIMSNRVLAATSKLFKWWQIQDDTFTTPIVSGMARGIANKRERALSKGEIRQVWNNVGADNFGAILNLLLLTGRRREEVAAMVWDELGIDAQGKPVWNIPAARNKINKPDSVPLTAEAWAIIEAQTKWARCSYVFSPNGEHRFQNFSRCKARLDLKVPNIPHWVPHDLRRTARTLMADLQIDDRVAELCLGHTIKGVEGTYNRHKYLVEKRDALEKLAAAILRITTGANGDETPVAQASNANGADDNVSRNATLIQ